MRWRERSPARCAGLYPLNLPYQNRRRPPPLPGPLLHLGERGLNPQAGFQGGGTKRVGWFCYGVLFYFVL